MLGDLRFCLFEFMLYVPVNSYGHFGTLSPFYGTFTQNKNAREFDIVLESGEMIQNAKYRSRAPGQCVRLKCMSRKITMQGFTFAATLNSSHTVAYK